MCLYGLGLLPILPISFMVEPQFHHGIRTGYPRAKPNGHTRSTSPGLNVTRLLSTCRLENPLHVRGHIESCPTLVRNTVCYVLI
ncbi:hypothetical protein DVH24_011555 [Malus domestica]|uniref:Uncharacterized protein n=1 Tax=Malus domestica TaxID=3750 RepID=A0A498JUT5_MALDO|nr:hypothetical protein DVH24_011555 [Malus domestica]